VKKDSSELEKSERRKKREEGFEKGKDSKLENQVGRVSDSNAAIRYVSEEGNKLSRLHTLARPKS
jgi:hypothetical protein